MKCPNCGVDVHGGSFCFACGVDTILFTKVINLSNILYNKGLAAANNNDLLGAYEALSKSVKINKNNYTARNLLGLVYLEIGQIGDAIKQWVISSSLVREDNIASTYIKAMSDSGRAMEKLNDAVSMYNQALIYTKQNSEDMAIIQLKKAIEINSKFVAAHNLLALIYIHMKDYNKANSLIEKVLSIDIGNKTAITYFKQLNYNKARPQALETKVTKTEPKPRPRHTNVSTFEPQKTSSFPYAAIISFIIGAVCAAAALYILVMPVTIGEKDMQISEVNERYNEALDQYSKEIIEKEEIIANLEQEITSLTNTNEQLLAERELQQQIQLLHQVSTMVQENNLEEAANLILTINTTNFPDESKESYDTLKTDIWTSLANEFYNSGAALYNRGSSRYEEAKVDLEKCLIYATDESFMANAIYYLGRIAESSNEKDLAKIYYERIINDLSDSNRFNDANSRLRGLS